MKHDLTMSEDDQTERLICRIVATKLRARFVTRKTRLNLGDHRIGGLEGLRKIGEAIEKQLGVTFAPDEPELWTRVSDMIESAKEAA
jgi:hypothetical protein